MGKRGSIAVLLVCEVGAMAVWFASAVVAALIRRDAGDAPGAAWLTAADRAQFSAGGAEPADPASIGTLLTPQTCLRFALTLVSIGLVPVVVGWAGWTGAFTMLAAGPLLGAAAMLLLRADPASARLAGGCG